MDADLVLRRSQVTMERVIQEAKPTTQEIRTSRHDASEAVTLSRELYIPLTTKTSLQAKNQMRPLQSTDELEAWRLIKRNLSKKDRQRSQAEYGVLTALPKLKSSDMLGL